jgi:hypothetical protein
VIALRAIDEFQESMFLHTTKYHDDADGDIAVFMGIRRKWSPAFFKSLAGIREALPEGHALFLRYAKSPDYMPSLLAAFGIEAELPKVDIRPGQQNKMLPLKCQSLLAHLPEARERVGFDIPRPRLVHAMYEGVVAFDDDVERYRVLPYGMAVELHEQALACAEESGIEEYLAAFGERTIEPYDCVALDFGNLADADFDRLRAWCEETGCPPLG